MLRRPLPHIPRGPRRRQADRITLRLLGCPRISPEWELLALAALIKPQLNEKLLHRPAEQKWTRASTSALQQALTTLNERLACDLTVHLPSAGDYHFVADVSDANSDQARASSVVLSKALPDLWLVVGRLFVKNGQFYRRRYGYKLALTPAADVHLPRALRASLKGCL